MSDAAKAIRGWLGSRVRPAGLDWLDTQCAAIAEGAPNRHFYMSFSAAGRHTGKAALDLTGEEREQAEAARPGWRPGGWTCEQAGRTLLVQQLPAQGYLPTLDGLFETADLGELVALYQALPVLPRPGQLVVRAAEGVRTNMTAVFCAVVHQNPYPREQFDQGAWNQMVLKSLFVGVALDPVDGLDQRANPALMRMLCDYAHERWAAGRAVSPELWRCVGPYADDAALEDLERALTSDEQASRQAAVLALRACPRPEAGALLEKHPVEVQATATWAQLARSSP